MRWLSAHFTTVLIAVLSAFLVALLGGLATRLDAWYYALRKPAWQPPDWLFGPVWTLIFACAAAAGVIAWGAAGDSQRWLVGGLFAVNGILNVLWSVLFFFLQRPDWALPEVVALWLSVLALMLAFLPFAPVASLLLLPYLVWVGFASFVNLAVVRLNGPFSGRR
jgi:benzodiazapine receptor